MNGTVLALNCGSSSVKFAAFGPAPGVLFRGQVENIGEGLEPRLAMADGLDAAWSPGPTTHGAILRRLVSDTIAPRAGAIAAVGHRVVHGGTRFDRPARIDDAILAEIAALAPLAPSHQPHNVAGVEAVALALPDTPQIACFDTAFHRTIPPMRQRMPLPAAHHEAGLRRFGFHGLSYESVVARLPDAMGARASGKVAICHLGAGCSLAGVVGGRSAYTSMGFTPLDGLMMGRRPGRLDPGAVLWLVDRHGGDAGAVDRLLNREAGLLGVSGLSPDMRVLLEAGTEEARLAVAMFVDRLVQEIGAAAAAIGGLDGLVFTGGIGENAAPVRARTLDALAWLGFEIDAEANEAGAATITPPGSTPSAHVVATDEEAAIAAATRALAARTPRTVLRGRPGRAEDPA